MQRRTDFVQICTFKISLPEGKIAHKDFCYFAHMILVMDNDIKFV